MIASNNANVENQKSGDTSAKERFRGEIEEKLAYYENANPRELTSRLAELDREWDKDDTENTILWNDRTAQSRSKRGGNGLTSNSLETRWTPSSEPTRIWAICFI
jgi:hypothetical protein